MRKLIIIFLLIALVLSGILWLAYKAVMNPALRTHDGEAYHLYQPSDVPFDSLCQNLANQGLLRNERVVEWLARAMKYQGLVKAGHYLLADGMSPLDLVRKFRSGNQDPIMLTFNGIRLREDLAGRLSRQLLLDSAAVMDLFHDRDFLFELGFTTEDALCLFIPNTYEVYWTIRPDQLFKRMRKEYDAFWNESRQKKASEAGLIPVEVSILASIVQEETNKRDEMSRVAGVYINRLNKRMKLQADPTVRFATRNFGIRRVLTSDLQVSSPYNTYQNDGLPPGPICLPEPQTIERVLNFEKHDYLFMAAKPDDSGYHNFSRTDAQHIQYANAYRRWLNNRGVYR